MKGWWSLGVVEVRNIHLFTNHKEGFELVHMILKKERLKLVQLGDTRGGGE